MTTGPQWRVLAHQKRKTAKRLIEKREWVAAAESMGYSLECALKASSCKTLGIETYPPVKNGQEMGGYFKTHELDSLLIFSGLEKKLRLECLAYGNFSTYFTGSDWPAQIRYNPLAHKKYTPAVVKSLYNYLYDDADSILRTIMRSGKW